MCNGITYYRLTSLPEIALPITIIIFNYIFPLQITFYCQSHRLKFDEDLTDPEITVLSFGHISHIARILSPSILVTRKYFPSNNADWIAGNQKAI